MLTRIISMGKYRCWFLERNYSTPIKMAYDVYGSSAAGKIPLIIMHGLLGSKNNWRKPSSDLANILKTKVYTVDARNHGDSPHVSEHSSQEMAADVAELMRSEHLKQSYIMGHSMGGHTMMYMALKYPNLVKSGIIVDISPISVPGDFEIIEQIFVVMKTVKLKKTWTVVKGREKAGEILENVTHNKKMVEFVLTNLSKNEKTGEFFWKPNVDAIAANIRLFERFLDSIAQYPPFQGPMLFLCGTSSNFVNPDHWPSIQKLFPNGQLEWLDAGHMVHIDQPKLFTDTVHKFIISH